MTNQREKFNQHLNARLDGERVDGVETFRLRRLKDFPDAPALGVVFSDFGKIT